MYGKPFNPNRPFGQVIGMPGVSFDQDGQLFNAMKMPVDGNGVPMPLPPGAEDKPVAELKKIEGDGLETMILPADDPDDDVPEDEKPFDILAWAQGDETLKATPWPKVKAETALLLGDATAVTKKEDARKAILAHYGLTA